MDARILMSRKELETLKRREREERRSNPFPFFNARANVAINQMNDRLRLRRYLAEIGRIADDSVDSDISEMNRRLAEMMHQTQSQKTGNRSIGELLHGFEE